MSKRRIAALALSGVALLGAQAALPTAVAAHAAVSGEVSPPAASHESGRYVGPQAVTLTSAEGTEVRYTLDGTHPTRDSALATGPILIEKTANLTAVAFTDRAESLPMIRGILVKTAEEPLAQFAVMSDIHLSTGTGSAMAKWDGYFDTLKRIAPNPDALISNGDQINDNYFNSAADHQYPREMLERNLARTGMTDTQVMMSFGNHDDYVTRMAEQYPDDWFPGTTGYYESQIGEFPAFVVNTEAWNTTQANWLYGRLDALSKDPATQGQPIFVFGHRPIPATVWDGAQASNGGLKTNLSAFPQVVYFSGHSHLNITDERSIHQQDFTSVNEGSMSYGENDGKFQVFGPGLARDATIPTAQSVVVDVYGTGSRSTESTTQLTRGAHTPTMGRGRSRRIRRLRLPVRSRARAGSSRAAQLPPRRRRSSPTRRPIATPLLQRGESASRPCVRRKPARCSGSRRLAMISSRPSTPSP